MKLALRSLQGRVTALVIAALAAVWIATAVAIWVDVRHELDELLDGHLAQAAALLVAQQARGFDGGDDDEEVVDAPTLHRYAPAVAFQVFHDGRLVARSARAPAAPMVPARMALQRGFADVEIDGRTWRVFAARGAKRDVQVYVGERARSRRDILLAVLQTTLWPLALAVPLLALATWAAVHRGTAPLRRLGRLLAARSPQALQPVTLDGAPSEMQPMLDALNQLFARIDALLAAERRFTADAAHELRTPIAAIRAQAQVALGELDQAARTHALRATLEGCDRATRLVEQLLTLSRVEADAAPPRQALDLAALARRVVAEGAAAALAKGQTVSLEADAPCTVSGDETLVGVLLRNLLDNAVRYSPPGATIDVTVQRSGTQVRLAVHDSGPGLSDDDLARLGQRFFRVLGSDASGSGLGWSIVRRIAQVHGATVRTGRSARRGGLAVEVDWPAA